MRRASPVLLAIGRWGLGLLFVYAAYHKILSPGAFAHEIHNYKILPVFLVNPMAIVLPWLELFCGVALLVGRERQGASALIALMMIVFTAAVTSAVARDLNISCGCFKTGGSAATWLTVARDLALTVVAVLVWRDSLGKDSWNSPT